MFIWRKNWLSRPFRLLLPLAAVLLMTLLTAGLDNAQAQTDGWQASYWNNDSFSGEPVLQRIEAAIDYDWGIGSPHPLVAADQFAVRWIRDVQLPTGQYRFTAAMDDGLRLWVDDTLIIDDWARGALRTRTAEIFLPAGTHQIRVEYFEVGGYAAVSLDRTQISGTEGVWQADYFNNMTLAGDPVWSRSVPEVDLSTVGAPVTQIGDDQFSIRWTRSLTLDPGLYRFALTVDDGARLWVDNQLLIDAWRDQAATTYTAEVDINRRPVPVRVDYYENSGIAVAQLNWTRVTAVPPPAVPRFDAWRGEYHNNISLESFPVIVRDDAAIDFDWGTGSPAPSVMGPERFSVRWTRSLELAPGRYEFTTSTDDGVRLWLDGEMVIDSWQVQALTNNSAIIDHAGGSLPVAMEYFENSGLAEVHLSWTAIPAAPDLNPITPVATMDGAFYLNVRAGPGEEYAPFGYLTAGQTVPVLGRDPSASWLQILLPDNRTGWVSSGFMNSNTPFAALPIRTP